MGNPALTDLKAFTNPQTLAINQTIEVSSDFQEMLPGASLRRGTVGVLVGTPGSGATSLFFSLIATPSQRGNWIALVGLENLGFASARGHGVELSRLVSVSCIQTDSAEVASMMLDGFDIVAVRAPIDATKARKLATKARNQKAVLIVLSNSDFRSLGWPVGSDFSIRVLRSIWKTDGMAMAAQRSLDVEVDSSRWATRRTRLVAGI